ncbi:MAG: SAM-dependent methyltransferase [Corynebacterium sp.]|nr:SAM-dependent methyltransferase [Corynebacterium sp.]
MAFTVEDIEFFHAHGNDIRAQLQHWGIEPHCGKSVALDMREIEKLRAAFGKHGRAVAELIHARAAGVRTHKIPWGLDSEYFYADADSIQQSTPAVVAAFRAQELADAHLSIAFDVTCSIGSEGAALTRSGITYCGSDLDASRLAMARNNVTAGHFYQADALHPPISADMLGAGGVVIADPARRAGGRRITSPKELLPPLPDVVDTYAGSHLLAKCAPGLDFSEWPGQVTLISVDGGVKEASLASPSLSDCSPSFAPRRRAVLLTSAAPVGDGECEHTVTNHVLDIVTPVAKESLPAAGPIGDFIIDPDGAIVRAGLVRDYAAREGLWQLDENIAYLTGPRIPQGRSGFRFFELVPIKKLKSALAAHDCGRVEILVRGVGTDPDLLRKKLKLKGSSERAVVITRIGRNGVALICGPREWAATK